MKHLLLILVCSCWMMPYRAFSQNANEATEPTVKGPGAIDLLAGGTLDAWKVPSAHWHLEQRSIIGQTGAEKLRTPEWLYTKQRFGNFEFTCELRLTGDNNRNSGIYFRVNTFLYSGKFTAPSGYEFDASPNNFWGSLADWYVRPSLRIYADPAMLKQAIKSEDWNRMTIRARGNRLEYWINGTKLMDYVDHDPKASREGTIGFQMHDGSVMKLEYRNIRLLPLKP